MAILSLSRRLLFFFIKPEGRHAYQCIFSGRRSKNFSTNFSSSLSKANAWCPLPKKRNLFGHSIRVSEVKSEQLNRGTLFDESAAPNHYKLAREFVLFDNFYVNADVSADGHNWAMAGIAPDYTQRHVAQSIRRPLAAITALKAASRPTLPPAGYLWTNAIAAGLTRAQLRRVRGEQEAGRAPMAFKWTT